MGVAKWQLCERLRGRVLQRGMVEVGERCSWARRF